MSFSCFQNRKKTIFPVFFFKVLKYFFLFFLFFLFPCWSSQAPQRAIKLRIATYTYTKARVSRQCFLVKAMLLYITGYVLKNRRHCYRKEQEGLTAFLFGRGEGYAPRPLSALLNGRASPSHLCGRYQ